MNDKYLIDTHAHLDFPKYDEDREEVIESARSNGVSCIVNVGADIISSRKAVELAAEYPFIFATVGIHPHDADELDSSIYSELERLAADNKVVAIGEIGLDYHYDNSPRDLQKEAFRGQLKMADRLGLPIAIHSREAEGDTLEILQDYYNPAYGGIWHCFGSDLKAAHQSLELGLYIAVGGVLTFKNADDLRDVIREVPIDRLLLETDSPYLTPVPHRGKRNEPAYVRLVAEKVAELKGISFSEVAEITTRNAIKVYNLPELD